MRCYHGGHKPHTWADSSVRKTRHHGPESRLTFGGASFHSCKSFFNICFSLTPSAAAFDKPALEASLQGIRWLARLNYQLELSPETKASEVVIFPQTSNESHGIEDLCMVRFVDDDGTVTYYGTRTGFDGYCVLPQLIETRDFLNSVARAEGISDLGFHACGQQGAEHLGMYGRLVSQSLTIHDLLETTFEFISSFNSGLHIWVEHHQDQVRYCQQYVDSLPRDLTKEVVHLGFATAMKAAKCALGADWRPNRIELPTDPIDLTAHIPGLADLPIAFNQPHTSIWLDQKLLSTPLPRSDSSSTSTMKQEDRAVLVATAPASEPIYQLEQVIESAMSHPEMSVPFKVDPEAAG